MPVTVKHDPATNGVTVTVTFIADPQSLKPNLLRNVQEHHWLAVQAALMCQQKAETLLNTKTAAQIDVEAQEAIDKINAERARKKAML